MKDRVIETLAAGEKVDLEDPELKSALADADFRRELVLEIAERFELEAIEPEGEMVKEIVGSEEVMGQFLEGVGFMLAMKDLAGDGLEPSEGPVASTPDLRPAPRSLSDGELMHALQMLSTAWFIKSTHGTTTPVDGDVFLLPNAEMCEIDVEWKRGLDAEGEIPIDPDGGTMSSSTLHVDGDGRVSPWVQLARDPAEGGLQSLEGRCTLKVPQKFASVRFEASQVGESQQLDGATVTLSSCQVDCVQLEGIDRGVPVVVIARDAAGQRLRQPEMQAMGDSMNLRYAGEVASVEVFRAAQVSTREFDIVARPEPSSDGPVVVTRYAPPRVAPEFGSIEPDQLEAELHATSGRLYSAFEFNRPAIQANLPILGNSLFAKVEFDTPTVTDESGSPVPFELANHGLDDALHCAQVSLEGEGDQLVEFAKVRGKVRVQYPLDLKIVKLSQAAPEAEGFRAEFDGNHVTIHCDDSREDGFGLDLLTDRLWREPSSVHGQDRDGRELQRLSQWTASDTWVKLSFWGNPDSVQILAAGRSHQAEIDYELEPTPLLADELCGMSPPPSRSR